MIGTFVPNIEKLRFSFDGRDIEVGSHFEHLKSLYLFERQSTSNHVSLATALKAFGAAVSLEYLFLSNFRSPEELVKQISNFKQLKELHCLALVKLPEILTIARQKE